MNDVEQTANDQTTDAHTANTDATEVQPATTGATEVKPAKAPRPQMEERNGIRRPRTDTLCGQTWAIFDAVSEAKGSPAALADCAVRVAEARLNIGNVRSEYARWRKFYGVSGRVESLAKTAANAEKARVAAEKAEANKLAAEAAAAAAAAAAAQAPAGQPTGCTQIAPDAPKSRGRKKAAAVEELQAA